VHTEDARQAALDAIATIAPDADVVGLRPAEPLRHQIELDSMDWVNVMAELGARLSLEIPEADYGRLTTLDAIVAYAVSRRARGDGGRGGPAAATPAAAPVVESAPAAAPALPARAIHRIDGTQVTVRPLRHEDLPLEADFVRHLSQETRHDRFMVAVSELPKDKLDALTDVDQVRQVALAATVQRDGTEAMVGVVRYAIEPPGDRCEFAVAVADDWQGTGLAGILMRTLIDIARARGLRTMEGIVLATNTRMLKFARQLGFTRLREPEDRETVRVMRSL